MTQITRGGMRELSLFTGAGGGLLGTLLLGWRQIGYVEFNEYCQRVIAQRIADGILPVAPIFGDIRTFVSEGYAAAYSGLVDVVSGGFPCQPFSGLGEMLGAADPRNMWPATAECVRIIRPTYCFFENVVNLLSSGYFGTIIADLAALGYGVRWGVLSACAVGAPHTRGRLFIVAHANGSTSPRRGQYVPGTEGIEWGEAGEWSQYPTKDTRPIRSAVWDTDEADILRVPNGMGSKLERIWAIGNGQVPAVAAAAWHLLTEELEGAIP